MLGGSEPGFLGEREVEPLIILRIVLSVNTLPQ